MVERDTGRSRGFGFITFADRRAMEDAIKEMNGQELDDRPISVNKAQPRMSGGDDFDRGYKGGYSSGSRGGYAGGDHPVAQDECFKCGRFGHWARDCPSANGRGSGGSLSSRSRFGGPASDRADRLNDRDRFMDDRYGGGGTYTDRSDRVDLRDKYNSRDRFSTDRYAYGGDRGGGGAAHERYVGDRFEAGAGYRYGGDRMPGPDRYGVDRLGPDDRYSGDRVVAERYGGGGGGGAGGPDRYSQNFLFDSDPPPRYDRDGQRGRGERYRAGGPMFNRTYRSKLDPYDRPPHGRPSSFDRY